MPDIATDLVAEVIILARELATDPDRAEPEFDALIDSMNDDEKASLVAIMWIGRGSFDPEDWDEALSTALSEATTPTEDYLKGSPHLADHLENGLEALGISAADAEDDLYARGR